jgi:hypothetical protein
LRWQCADCAGRLLPVGAPVAGTRPVAVAGGGRPWLWWLDVGFPSRFVSFQGLRGENLPGALLGHQRRRWPASFPSLEALV